MNWAQEEVRMADLGDKRLNARLGLVLEQLGQKPQLSIPAAWRSWTETLGAYRFFDNPKATFDNVLSSYCVATKERIAACPVVLLAQDPPEDDDCVCLGPKGLGTLKPMHAGCSRRSFGMAAVDPSSSDHLRTGRDGGGLVQRALVH